MATRVVALLVLLLGLYASVSFCATTYIYGITIDAGSSGSRIYIYKWPSRNTTSLPIVQVVTNKKVSPGISSFSSNVTGVVDHLQPLIDYAKINIPQTSYNNTYLFLKATAGMRLLSTANQEAILAVARTTLKASPFIFQNSYAKVISGAEEGLFAYITANFVKNTLVTGAGTGVMDLGGASTQIALDSTSGSAADTTTLKVENRTRTVYTVSFLGIGKDQAILTVKDNIATHATGSSASNPCANVGYDEVVKNVTLVGTGDFDSCLTLVNNVTSTVIAASGTTLPKTDIANTQFVAFSAFYYSAAFLNLVAPTVADSKATITQFVSAGQNFCKIGWSNAKIQFPSETESFLKDDCTSAAIVVSLLRQYGFSNSSNNVAFVSTIGTFEIGWQLGAMVYEANLLPIDSPIIAPAAPTNVKATSISSTSVFLSWTAPETGGANITQYYVKVKTAGGSYTNDALATESADANCTVINLDPNTQYVFKVAAANSAGVGDYSADSNTATTSGAAAAARVSVMAIVLAVVVAVVFAL